MQSDTNKENKKSETKDSIIISSRIRLARNVAGEKFVNSADAETLARVFEKCVAALSKTRKLKDGKLHRIDELSSKEKLQLLETRKISTDMLDADISPRGLFLSKDASCGAMINEEDHLRIFLIGDSLCLRKLWLAANSLDDNIEANLEYAFSEKYGYLTACPTNVGTGLRASVMMHLPALEICGDMEKIMRGVNQLGMTFRGKYGEGSESNGAIFQLSNQQTLGVDEETLVDKIIKYAKKVRQFELDARARLAAETPLILADKISRAYAILSCCKLIDSEECAKHLSTLRLAADLGVFSAQSPNIDELSSSLSPAFLSDLIDDDNPLQRDKIRAELLQGFLSKYPPLNLKKLLEK